MTKNQVIHVPPYYYITEEQEQRLQSLRQRRSASKGRVRSLLSRRAARR